MMGASQGWRFLSGFALTLIGTRYLSPTDFGILAMVATATVLLVTFRDLGVGQAIIQSRSIGAGQINALFWISAGMSLAAAALLVGGARGLAQFYSEPAVEALAVAFAPLVLVGGIQTVPLALMNRKSEFKVLAIIDVVGTSAALIVGVIAVIHLETYWAIYASITSTCLITAAAFWWWSGYRPGAPQFDKESRMMLGFGAHIAGYHVVEYFSGNLDNILIGRVLGGFPLGLYDRAYKLLLLPMSQLNTPIGQVLVPLLSRIQDDARHYRTIYTDTVSLMMLATQPGILFAIICAPEVFLLLFGEQWVAAAPVFQWLGIAGLHQVLTSTTRWLFISQGRGSDLFRLGVLGSIITVTSFAIGLPWGVVGVAMSYTIINYLFYLPLNWLSLGRAGPVSYLDLVAIAAPHALATLASALAVLLLRNAWPAPTALGMIGFCAFSYAAYLGFLSIFASKRIALVRAWQAVKDRQFSARFGK